MGITIIYYILLWLRRDCILVIFFKLTINVLCKEAELNNGVFPVVIELYIRCLFYLRHHTEPI